MDNLWAPMDPKGFLHHLYCQAARLVGVHDGPDDVTGVDVDHHVRVEVLALHRPSELGDVPAVNLSRAGGHQLGTDPGRVAGQPPPFPHLAVLTQDRRTSTKPSTGTCPRPGAGRRPATAAGPQSAPSPAWSPPVSVQRC